MSTIFSIGDNSNYNSILSQSKALKENKEKSKINFVNALIKDNVTKLNELQTQNTINLVKNETLTLNPLDNTLQNSIYTLKYKQADTSNAVSKAYGYGVDSEGYMSSDFNKAAGLPDNFKIHKSTLDEIKRYNTNLKADTADYLGISSYYSNIDMADTIKQYYSKFNQIINHTFSDPNKTSFSEEDLQSLPKGYSLNNKNLEIPYSLYDKTITNYYYTKEQYDTIDELGMKNRIDTGLQRLNFTPESMQTQNLTSDKAQYAFNPDMSFYPQNEDGSYSREALFMSFLKTPSAEVLAGGDTQLNPIAKAYVEEILKQSSDASLAHLDAIMTGKVDFASLLKAQALEGWLDTHIYAYENGNTAWNSVTGYGGAWFDKQFNQAKASGWSPSNQSINSYVNSVMEQLNDIINQTRVV